MNPLSIDEIKTQIDLLLKTNQIITQEQWNILLKDWDQNKTAQSLAKALIPVFDHFTEKLGGIYNINSIGYKDNISIFLLSLIEIPCLGQIIIQDKGLQNAAKNEFSLFTMRVKNLLYKTANVENLPTSPKVSQKRQLLIESDIKRIKKKSKALAIILINLKRIQMGSVFTLAEN